MRNHDDNNNREMGGRLDESIQPTWQFLLLNPMTMWVSEVLYNQWIISPTLSLESSINDLGTNLTQTETSEYSELISLQTPRAGKFGLPSRYKPELK